MDEFEVINRYFRPLGTDVAENDVGIGDDASVLAVPNGQQVVVTTDTHVESVHFPIGAEPYEIGFRSCTTSLSDLAAMGATARWASLALTIADPASVWLAGFADGAAAALKLCSASLVGGDTTRGPLTITWNIIGTVPVGETLLRSGATPGDAIYVSGTLGSAAAALELSLTGNGGHVGDEGELRDRYWSPRPRFDLGRRLHPLASACIDISDGLIADLSHIARSSQCGAEVECTRIPLARELVALAGAERGLQLALGGGDDYELCFTVPHEHEPDLIEVSEKAGVMVTRIGRMVEGKGVRVIDDGDREVTIDVTGYLHFE